jgi:phosphatidylserine decarboxylase
VGGRAVRQVLMDGLDVRPTPFGLWLAGETGRTDIGILSKKIKKVVKMFGYKMFGWEFVVSVYKNVKIFFAAPCKFLNTPLDGINYL